MTENKDGQDTMHPIHLCIGAPRAGTTWLFREMSRHPALFVPLVKEVRFWNSRRADMHRDNAINDAKAQITDAHDAEDQTRWIENWGKINQKSEITMQAYLDLMSVKGRASLDISPSYCFLPPSKIKELRAGLPKGSKVIYLMRDPIQRLSSQVKLHFTMHGTYRGRPSADDLAEFMKTPSQRKRWDYATILSTWSSEFGDDFIPLPFDSVVSDPKGLTQRVADVLQFDLAADVADRDPNDFFHADLNQNTQAWITSLGPKEKKQMAQTIEPDIVRFAEQMPDPGARWLEKVRSVAAADITQPDSIDDVDLPTQKLMRMTESLGQNCEYGFWQRHRGYEPSSLFRWAITPIDSLLAFMENPQPMYALEDIEPHSPGMVNDASTGFKFHSKLVENDSDGKLQLLADKAKFAEIYADEAAKIAHFQAKFFTQMKRQAALYVVKFNQGLPEDKVKKLLGLIRSYNKEHHLLWIEPDGPPAFTDLGGGLLRGSLPGFAPHHAADAYVEGGFTSLMTQLSQHPPLAEQIARMQR